MNLLELVQVADDKRDPDWENQFFMEVSKGNLKVLAADAQQGPDGWPYILTQTSGEATEPAQKLMQWCATKGIGLVVNPQKNYPDYVFTYGMLWHFKETGLFYRNAFEMPTGNFELTEGVKLHSGPPSPDYLPGYVRSILREFFRDQGVLRPKILVISTDKNIMIWRSRWILSETLTKKNIKASPKPSAGFCRRIILWFWSEKKDCLSSSIYKSRTQAFRNYSSSPGVGNKSIRHSRQYSGASSL